MYSFAGERQTLIQFSQALERYTELGIKQGLTKGLLIGCSGMIYIHFGIQSWIGSILVTEKEENGGNISMAGLCVIMGGIHLMSALSSISFLIEAKAAATRINEIIGRIPLINSEDKKGETLRKVRGDIEFRSIFFCYPSRPDIQILNGFSLTVKAGETVGLVGSSGSGKSTIISLLERFYDPIKGDILIDGQNIKTLQLRWLRSQIGLVSQESILFTTSIKENILFGKEEATMDHVIAAAKAANAHNFIAELPKGYETEVGQFGSQLSGGQRQRIAIARALLRDPKILLLDEATSALDADSEKIIQEALDQALVGRTTIIIAHRLTTIQKANNIVVLQSGVVLESGPHDELMQNKNGQGAYFKMVQLQQSATKNDTASTYDGPSHVYGHRRIRSFPTSHGERLRLRGSPLYVHDTYTNQMLTSKMQSPVVNNYGENLKNKSSNSASQWGLLKMNAPEWKRALLGCIGAIGFGAIQPANAYLIGLVISTYWQTDKRKIKSEARTYALLYLSLGILSFITNVLQHYDFAVMGERLTKRVQVNMLQKLLTFEVGWFDEDKNTSAAISARLASDANMVKSLVGDRISLLILTFTNTLISYTVALVVTWRLAIVMIAMQPLLIACFYSKKILLKKMLEKTMKAQAKASQLASEATTNHRTIMAFSSQERILNLFAVSLEHPRKENIKQSWFSGLGLSTSVFLTAASVIITFWYGLRLIDRGLIEPKPLLQAFFLLLSTSKSVADAGSMTSDLSKGAGAIDSLFAILDRKSEIEPDDPEGIKAVVALKGEIVLTNVFFFYPSRPDQMILKGLSLKINYGRTFALVGKSGSGKSTIIGLIERFYDPLNGSIFIDDQDIKSYNLRSLRSHIALVSQEPTLFAGTIRQNILYGKSDATDSELTEAATLANAHEFISSMTDGYETYCGERGVQLSGGQKQRIALARAILKNPTILLLDEATSALDSISENLVQEALEKMMVGRTSVIIAHRLSTIQKSDTIVVIQDGKVAEQGSHSDLLGQGGAYYSLIKLQNNHNR